MKKMRHIIMAGILTAVMTIGAAGLAGCGEKATAESLIKKSEEKMNGGDGTSMDMDMDINMSMSIFGQSMDMDISGKMHTDAKDENTKMTGTMQMTGDGQNETADLEAYVIKEGDSYVSYSRDQDGNWNKQTVDADAVQVASNNIILTTDYSGFTLEEENNQYIVSGEVDISEAYKMMGSQMSDQMGELFGEDVNVDFSSLPKAQLKYIFDKKSRDLISGEVEMTEAMDAMMSEVMKASISQSMGGIGEGIEGMDLSSMISVKIGKAYVNITNISYGNVPEIVLPDEAKSASEGTDNDPGSLFEDEMGDIEADLKDDAA